MMIPDIAEALCQFTVLVLASQPAQMMCYQCEQTNAGRGCTTTGGVEHGILVISRYGGFLK